VGSVENTVALRQVFVGHYGFSLPIIMPSMFQLSFTTRSW